MTIKELQTKFPQVSFAQRDKAASRYATAGAGGTFIAGEHSEQGSIYVIKTEEGYPYCLYPENVPIDILDNLITSLINEGKIR